MSEQSMVAMVANEIRLGLKSGLTDQQIARAALKKMREPTEAMVEAAVGAEYGSDLPTTKRGDKTVGGTIVAEWRAAIDAALKED